MCGIYIMYCYISCILSSIYISDSLLFISKYSVLICRHTYKVMELYILRLRGICKSKFFISVKDLRLCKVNSAVTVYIEYFYTSCILSSVYICNSLLILTKYSTCIIRHTYKLIVSYTLCYRIIWQSRILYSR